MYGVWVHVAPGPWPRNWQGYVLRTVVPELTVAGACSIPHYLVTLVQAYRALIYKRASAQLDAIIRMIPSDTDLYRRPPKEPTAASAVLLGLRITSEVSSSKATFGSGVNPTTSVCDLAKD